MDMILIGDVGVSWRSGEEEWGRGVEKRKWKVEG